MQKVSEKNEREWAAIAVNPETHKAVKVAAAQAGIRISDFMARLSELAPDLARRIEEERRGGRNG